MQIHLHYPLKEVELATHKQGEEFVMKPDYINLQKIHRGEMLATSNGEPILSPANAHILMPLYQKQGSFGCFIAKEVNGEYLESKESKYTKQS